MRNPLNGVLASLFLIFLESGSFNYRVAINTTYFRYIDDILIFLPQNIKTEEITEKINNVDPRPTLHLKKNQIISYPNWTS